MTIRETILQKLDRKGWPVNRLAQAAEDDGICTRQMVYNWLNNDQDIGVSKAEALLSLLK